MILNSLQGRLTILFAAFALLMLVSVGAMVSGSDTQKQDALVINLAGRQRMLTQQMARLAIKAGAGEETINTALQNTEQVFEQTLHALMDGGTAPYFADTTVTLPRTNNLEIRSSLNELYNTWRDFRTLLDNLQQTPRNDPSFSITLHTIEQKSSTLAEQADEAVRMFEASSTTKIKHLRSLQIGFLVGALIFLSVGAFVTRQSLLRPLGELERAANSLGENDLETPIEVQGPKEMRILSQAFESMRVRLRSSYQELLAVNVSLEERVLMRTRELETFNEVSREISSRLDIQQVLNSVTEKARSLIGGDVASICLVDENQHWMKLQASSGPQNAVVGNTMRADEEFTDTVLGNEQAMICGIGSCQGGCRMLSEEYRTSHLAAPLRIGERVIGALCVGSSAQNSFSAESADILTKLANVAAIAMENARLFAQAEKMATLDERRRVAVEMHDGLGQTLSYLGLMTDQVVNLLSDGQEGAALERLQKTRETIGKATNEVRSALYSLMDVSPSTKDICTRLHDMLDEFATEHNLKASWELDIVATPECSSQVAEHVFNITREALNNIAHHAQAKQIRVRLGEDNGLYLLIIEDDGKGFDQSQPKPSGHFGLQIMQARGDQIGGRVTIESKESIGTLVTLSWPKTEGNQ